VNHRRTIAGATIPLVVSLTLVAGPTQARPSTHSTQATSANRATTFAFKSWAFGTRIIRGKANASSSSTANKAISCTNRAGLSRDNSVTSVALPDLGTASKLRTRVWTASHHGVIASHSTHRISRVNLAQSGLGSLAIHAVASHATASHDATGFHATVTTHVGALTFTPPVGPAQSLPLPTPDQPVTIPGVVTIYTGSHSTRHSAAGATANGLALRVDWLATGESVRLARTHAELDPDLTSGVFKGHSAATHVVSALDDTVTSGPNPLTTMPCEGTNGRMRQKANASTDLAGQLVVKGASSRERGNQGLHGAHGMSRGKIDRVVLGGQLVINDIVGKATVSRQGGQVTKSSKGTHVGSVTLGG
jgi:hypothetical protein